jgi:YVTN family beta-propeller protein
MPGHSTDPQKTVRTRASLVSFTSVADVSATAEADRMMTAGLTAYTGLQRWLERGVPMIAWDRVLAVSLAGRFSAGTAAVAMAALALSSIPSHAASYQIFVSNEKSNDVTVIGSDLKVVATIPVGKRPRGIHVSPDGKTVYVAVSGTPVSGPPELDAQGNPILKRGSDDDDDAGADKAADGIAVVDVATDKFSRKINAGSDPEEFDLSKDGTRIYISNEDTKSATVLNIAAQKVEHIIPVGQEPEGVTTTPDGKFFYVTCEAGGDVYVVDTTSYAVAGHFKVAGRPRSVDFLSDGSVGFVGSESVGQVNIVDTTNFTVSKTLTLPKGSRPMRIRVAADGKKFYVSNGRAGTVSVLDTHTDELLDTIQVGARPWGIAISPDGKYLFSANGPSNDVSVVDLATDKEITRVKAGTSPWGVVVVPTAR